MGMLKHLIFIPRTAQKENKFYILYTAHKKKKKKPAESDTYDFYNILFHLLLLKVMTG